MNPLMANMGNMQHIMQTVNNIRRMMNGQNPDSVVQMMARQNPQFAQFLKDNQGKSPEQIAKDYGIDWGMIQGLMK